MPTPVMFDVQLPKPKGFSVMLTETEFQTVVDTNGGYCTACGEEAFGVEPDAEGYECDNCGDCKVYGIESLLLDGRVIITQSRAAARSL